MVLLQPSILIRPNSKHLGEKIGVHIIGFINKLGLMKSYKPLSVKKVARALLIAGKRAKQPIVEMGVKEIIILVSSQK